LGDFFTGAMHQEDQILDVLMRNFDEVSNVSHLNLGDLITWHTQHPISLKTFDDGRLITENIPYTYTSHIGIYITYGTVFSKLGWQGPYSQLPLLDNGLSQYGDIRYWRWLSP